MDINTVAIGVTPQEVVQKYRPLKKIKIELFFDMVYYPFYTLKVAGSLNGFLVKDKPINGNFVVDGCYYVCKKLINYPDLIVGNTDEEVSGVGDCFVVKKLVSQEKAGKLARDMAMKMWEKKHNHPFRPRITPSVLGVECETVYKSYYIIHNGINFEKEMTMIVDAVTGVPGLPESNNVFKQWAKMKQAEQPESNE